MDTQSRNLSGGKVGARHDQSALAVVDGRTVEVRACHIDPRHAGGR